MAITKEYVEILSKGSYRTFIESGCYEGVTSQWASERFEKVYTCEPSPTLHGNCTKNIGHVPNITLSNKISEDFFREILPELEKEQKRCVFWLDGHYSGGDCYGQNYECPLINELLVINSFKLLDPVIIIDDLGMFLRPPSGHNVAMWPSLDQVIEAANKCDHEYKLIRVSHIEDIICITTSKEPKVIYEKP